MPVYVPYMMGCGLGGGDWPTYREIIRNACPGARICCLHFVDFDVYTTSFSRLKSLPEDVIPVCIARYAPKNLRGNIASYPRLFPPQHLLSAYKNGKVGQKEYRDTYYREVLSQVGIDKALQDLKGFGNKVALVCYEKAGDFCHRHIVGDWVKYLSGYQVEEIPGEKS